MSDDKIVNLGERLAERDCRHWTVRDCLQAALDDIDSGKLDARAVFICFAGVEGSPPFPQMAAGSSAFEARGLVAQHLA